MDVEGLIAAAVELGILLASLFAGGRYALRRIRREHPSLTAELARDLRNSTPPPERDSIPRTDGEQVIASFGVVVGTEVARANRPLEHRVERLGRKVDHMQVQIRRLTDADAEIRSRQDAQSERIDHVQDIATGPITLELDDDEGAG